LRLAQAAAGGHWGADGGAIVTRILRDGVLRLDPPGLEIALAEMYGGWIAASDCHSGRLCP
jgi:hypothetical protein